MKVDAPQHQDQRIAILCSTTAFYQLHNDQRVFVSYLTNYDD